MTDRVEDFKWRGFILLNIETLGYEAVNILLLTCITELANVLKTKIEMDVPKFSYIRNIKFMKTTLLDKYSDLDSLISMGQFRIISCKPKSYAGGGRKLPKSSSMSFIQGRFVVVY